MMLGASINEEREKLMDTMKNLSTSAYAAIGMMLFALFFGAGNLIFPASLGQQAGDNVGWAILGFILTGVGLPLLGVIAMGYSGCKNAEELAGRVSPLYGRLYTVLLYLSIGPFFAIPRTGTVSYEIAVKPFFKNAGSVEETVFLVAFFAISLWLSINPHKLVNRIGKVLTPALLTVIVLLIIKSFITPIGGYSVAQGNYVTTGSAVLQGFLDGYNTMDALASICFAVLVIDFVKLAGAHTKEQITSAVTKTGTVAVVLLGVVYIFVAMIGATSVEQFGLFDTGAPVLSHSAQFLFGDFGGIILGIIVLLACLTTSIGLITSCSAYFGTIYSGIGYKTYVVIFSLASLFFSMYGLKTIISAAIPVLMLLYPLTIVIIGLSLMNSLFDGRRCVYAWTIGLTMISALMSGLEAASLAPGFLESVFRDYVPFHMVGMGWIGFAIVGFIIGMIHKSIVKAK